MIEFDVLGEPAPQGSKRHVGGGRMVEMSKRLGPWREAVKLAARREVERRELRFERGVPVSVAIEFRIRRGKSVKREFPTVAPDIDKLVRSTLDGLTQSAIIDDDAQVVKIKTAKVYAAQPGARIRLEEWKGCFDLRGETFNREIDHFQVGVECVECGKVKSLIVPARDIVKVIAAEDRDRRRELISR